MKILAIGAHPDDIELGLGGSLARYVEKGKEVYALILSKGEKGVRDEKVEGKLVKEKDELKGKMREDETRKALNLLGVKNENIKILGLPDGGIKPCDDAIEKVYEHIMKVNPDVIYTHFFEDDHLDHISTSLITLHAGRRIKNILFYESPSIRTSFSPNYFVDISDYIDKKVKALKMHKTQEGKPYMDEEVIKAKARFRGFQARVKYAEGFVVYRWVETKEGEYYEL